MICQGRSDDVTDDELADTQAIANSMSSVVTVPANTLLMDICVVCKWRT